MSDNNITIVTAFFDIGRGNWHKTTHGLETPHYIARSTDKYFECFTRLAKMKNDMIIYCAEEHKEKIEEIRKQQAPESRTVVASVDYEATAGKIRPFIESIQMRPEYINLVNDPRMPEYWNADYVLINYMKTDFVNHAIKNNLVKTELVAWLDFGYVRGEGTLPESLEWSYNFDPTKMHYFNKTDIDYSRPIFDIIKTNSVYIMGCHIVGGHAAWIEHQKMCHVSLDKLLSCGLVDDDQTILLMNLRSWPDRFQVHRIEIQQEEWNEWNVAMIKFNDKHNAGN